MRIRDSKILFQRLLLTVAVCAVWAGAATAQTFTWDGSTSNLWSEGTNWAGNAAPTSPASLEFGTAGAGNLSNNNDLAAGLTVNSILFPNVVPTGYTLTGNSINLNGNITNSATSGTNTINLPLQLTASPTINVATGGTLTIGGSISETGGARALTKTNVGTLILTGANTYSGGTTINASGGTVLVNNTSGSGTGSGAVTVGSGSTLGGTGTIDPTGASTVSVTNGGTLAPGPQTGPLTAGQANLTIAGNTSLAANSTFRVLVTGGSPTASGSGLSTSPTFPGQTTNTGLRLTEGTLTIGNNTNIVIDGTGTTFVPGQQYSYVIAQQATGTPSIGSLNQNDFSTIGFEANNFSLTTSGGSVILNFTPVPEPATVLGVAAAALGVGGLIRRRLRRETPTAVA